MRDYKLGVNIITNDSIQSRIFKQNDTGNKIELQLYYNDRLQEDNKLIIMSNQTVKAFWRDKEGNTYERTCEVTFNGTIIATTDKSILSCAGNLILEIKVFSDNGEEMTTPTLNFTVQESIDTSGAITEDTRYHSDIVTNLLSTMNTVDEYYKGEVPKIETKYADNLNKLNQSLEDYKNGINRLVYFSASNTLTNGSAPTDIVYQHLKYQGIDQTLIVMVNITSKTDSNPIIMDNSRVTDAIDRAKTFNVNTIMLKPHLGIGWSDGTERYNLAPSDMPAMLTKWKEILINYGEICINKGIPVLCIGCEQRTMTTSAYKSYWEDIITTLKELYPSLLLTYACDSVEGVQYDTSCIYTLEGLDFIGLNLYPQWYKEVYNSNLTYKDIMPSAYSSYAPTGEGFRLMDRINYIKDVYNKDVYITEIGVMPFDDGLVTLKSENAYDETALKNYNVPAICYESVFNTFAKEKNVVGISLWHTKFPFSYFNVDSIDVGNSQAEEIIKKYIEGGDLVG